MIKSLTDPLEINSMHFLNALWLVGWLVGSLFFYSIFYGITPLKEIFTEKLI